MIVGLDLPLKQKKSLLAEEEFNIVPLMGNEDIIYFVDPQEVLKLFKKQRSIPNNSFFAGLGLPPISNDLKYLRNCYILAGLQLTTLIVFNELSEKVLAII